MGERARVNLTACPAGTPDAEVVAATEQAILGLPDFGKGLEGRRKIAMKVNAGVARFTLTRGHQTELTDPAVVEGVVRALRRVTDAEILVGDDPTQDPAEEVYGSLGLPERLAPYPGVRLVDFGRPPFVEVPVPGEPLMFSRYWLHAELASADAFASVAKMKAHRALGCTLCIKNLFGWIPSEVYGRPRNYLHDGLIRLPRVIADLASLFRPALNVVDGVVAASHGEWHGMPVEPGVILAGTNAVATDSVGARVMGFDPRADFPTWPFLYRTNAIRLAAAAGLGPSDPDSIEVLGVPVETVRQEFTVASYGGSTEEREEELRRGALCVRRYRERRDWFLDRFPGRLVALKDGQVLWDAADMPEHQRMARQIRDYRERPQFVVRVVPEHAETENLDAYALYEGVARPVALST